VTKMSVVEEVVALVKRTDSQSPVSEQVLVVVIGKMVAVAVDSAVEMLVHLSSSLPSHFLRQAVEKD
jgi:hypothetical protein